MRSESTSALGQPRETKPTLGAAGMENRQGDRLCTAAIRHYKDRRPARLPCGAALLLVFGLLVVLIGNVCAGRTRGTRRTGETWEGKAGEHIAGLALQLLLHLREHIAALVHV